MNYLFIHQNFPAQYVHLLRHLANRPGNQIHYITQPNSNSMAGVHKTTYPKDQRERVNCHAYTVEIDRAIYAAASVADRCRDLRSQGFQPRSDRWSQRLGRNACSSRTCFRMCRCLPILSSTITPTAWMWTSIPSSCRSSTIRRVCACATPPTCWPSRAADWGHSATRWQKQPLSARDALAYHACIHEGVDTDIARPNPTAAIPAAFGSGRGTDAPQRGGHLRGAQPRAVSRLSRTFMRALPQLLATPQARRRS
jgi:hypothetical protein